MSVSSLTVHKNTIERRRKKALSKELRAKAESMTRDNDIRAYALVGIGADGKAYAVWDTGAILPLWAFADTVSSILHRDIDGSGVEEDWKPSIKV